MIPKSESDLSNDIEIEVQSSKTYRIDLENKRIVGMTDGIEAMRQSIFMILNTERYEHMIFSWNYGVEGVDLIGEDKAFAYPEIKRVISEALLQDDRITAVENFTFATEKGVVNVNFTVITTEGNIEIGKVVNI